MNLSTGNPLCTPGFTKIRFEILTAFQCNKISEDYSPLFNIYNLPGFFDFFSKISSHSQSPLLQHQRPLKVILLSSTLLSWLNLINFYWTTHTFPDLRPPRTMSWDFCKLSWYLRVSKMSPDGGATFPLFNRNLIRSPVTETKNPLQVPLNQFAVISKITFSKCCTNNACKMAKKWKLFSNPIFLVTEPPTQICGLRHTTPHGCVSGPTKLMIIIVK